MREELVEAVLRVVEEIPPGRAATYGMIARAVGTGPRVVGRIMHDWGGGVPWWRVVNVHGTFRQLFAVRDFLSGRKRGCLTIWSGENFISSNALWSRNGSTLSHERSLRICRMLRNCQADAR